MAKVVMGNASAITVPLEERGSIRRFYCDILGAKLVKQSNETDIFRLDEDFYILFRYADVPDESEFLCSPRALWLQLKTDNVEELSQKIQAFGARKLDLPSGLPASVPYLYFQAPGGQCFQLLPLEEDQSYYKGKAADTDTSEQRQAELLKERAIDDLTLKRGQTG